MERGEREELSLRTGEGQSTIGDRTSHTHDTGHARSGLRMLVASPFRSPIGPSLSIPSLRLTHVTAVRP